MDPADPPPVVAPDPFAGERAWERAHARGRTGGLLVVGGAMVGVAGVGVAAMSWFPPDGHEDPGATWGLLVGGAGGAAALAGEALLLSGAVGSARAVGRSPTPAWVAVGAAVAALPVLAVSPPVGAGVALVAPVLAGIDLERSGRAAERRGWSWHLAPTGSGAVVAVAF